MGSPGTLGHRGGKPPLGVSPGCCGSARHSEAMLCGTFPPPMARMPSYPRVCGISLLPFPFCFKFLQIHLFIPRLVTNAATLIRSNQLKSYGNYTCTFTCTQKGCFLPPLSLTLLPPSLEQNIPSLLGGLEQLPSWQEQRC